MVVTLVIPAFAALLIGLAIYGAGSFIHRAGSHLERWLWGFAGWVLMLFVLASLGFFRPPVLQLLVLVCGLSGSVALFRCVREPSSSRITSRLVAGSVTAVWAGPLVLVFAITVNPTMSWDAAVYHLTLPDLYLREGGFRTIPFLVYGVWPQAVDLLFGVALALHDYVAAKALHFGFGLLTAATLFAHAVPVGQGSARRQLDPVIVSVTGILAAGIFLLNDVVLFELRAAYVDLAMAFFALAGFLLLDCWLDAQASDLGPSLRAERERLYLLVGVGLACGLLAATKVNGIVTALGILLLAGPRLLLRLRSAPTLRAGLAPIAAVLLPIFLLWAPWVVRTWTATGNPVFPLYWGVFGGPDWNGRLADQFLAWQQSIGMGRESLDYLLLPWRIFTAGGPGYDAFDGRLTPLWLLCLPLAVWRARTSTRARRALIAAGLIFLGWSVGSQQMRFLIPALPLLALAVADGVWGVLSIPAIDLRLRTPLARRSLAGVVLLGWLAAFGVTQVRIAHAGWSHLKLYSDPRFVRPDHPPRSPVYDQISGLPSGSTVLLLNTNHLFHCRPTRCIANSFFEAPQIDAWLAAAHSDETLASEEVVRRLAERGVTHLAWVGLPRFQHAEPILEVLDRPDLVQPVFEHGSDRLWRLALHQGRLLPASEAP